MINMKLLLISFYTLFTILVSNAQVVEQISVGAGYTFQTFYEIETGEQTTIDGDSWDIAFSVFGFQDAGVFINEATASMGVELELYDLGVEPFTATFSQGDLVDRLYNADKSWQTGAFNEVRDPSNFADFGWGSYNPGTMSVDGNRVYALKLRNGTILKLQIEGLVGTAYTFTYAELDGSNQKSVTFDKSDFAGKHLAYFSFATEEMKDLEPANWDLVYTRYATSVSDPGGSGEVLDYIVTGILSADGVEVAQADEIDPLNVLESNYENEYSSEIDVIGFDWKQIDITTFQWNLILDRVYFVKTKANKKYKLYFIDFEGSSTGVATLEKTEVITSSVSNLFSDATLGEIYPNPTSGEFTFTYDTERAHDLTLSIYQFDGQRVYSKLTKAQAGNNVISIEDFDIPGNYFLVLNTGGKVFNQTLIIK